MLIELKFDISRRALLALATVSAVGFAALFGLRRAEAKIDTSWIQATKPITAAAMKTALDDAESRLAKLESSQVVSAYIGSDGKISSQRPHAVGGVGADWIVSSTTTATGVYSLVHLPGMFNTELAHCTCSPLNLGDFRCVVTEVGGYTTNGIGIATFSGASVPASTSFLLICR